MLVKERKTHLIYCNDVPIHHIVREGIDWPNLTDLFLLLSYKSLFFMYLLFPYSLRTTSVKLIRASCSFFTLLTISTPKKKRLRLNQFRAEFYHQFIIRFYSLFLQFFVYLIAMFVLVISTFTWSVKLNGLSDTRTHTNNSSNQTR